MVGEHKEKESCREHKEMHEQKLEEQTKCLVFSKRYLPLYDQNAQLF